MQTSPSVRKLLFTPVEAARVLAISRSKLYQLLATGELRSVVIGKCRRVTADALAEFVESLPSRGRGL